MLGKKIKTMENKYKKGFKLLKKNQFEKSKEYFSSHLEDDNYIVYYGLATANFKEKPGEISKEETNRIIDLYLKSIEKKEDFADGYFMLGMAYQRLTSIKVTEFQEKSSKDLTIENIQATLTKAQESFEKAIELDPDFKETLQSEIMKYDE